MKNFFRTFIHKINAAMPFVVLIIFAICIYAVYIDMTVLDLTLLVTYTLGVEIWISAAIAFNEEHEKNMSYNDREIIGKCFRGFSKSSRLFNVALSELNETYYNDALEDFKEIEDMDISEKEKSVLCFYIGKCYNAMGYPTNAANYYSKSIECGIDHDFVYILAARCYVTNGSYNSAMKLYEDLLNKGTFFDYIYTDMGMCCLKSDDPDNALVHFNKSITEHKNYSFALGGCSLAYLMKKDIEKSKEFFSKALINNVDDIDGFRGYYCAIAEAKGCLDLVDDYMKSEAARAERENDPESVSDY